MESSAYSEYFEEDDQIDDKTHFSNNLFEVCNTHCKSNSDLRKHIQAVHKEIWFPCTQCEYKATTQGSLKKHIESVHEKVKYPCNLCEYKATTQLSLKRHIKSVHEKKIS